MVPIGKDELVRGIAAHSGLEVGQARAALEAVLAELSAQIAAGNEVRLTGFGKFSATQRAARQGVNPQTGTRLQIAAKRVPKFSPGAKLRRAVEQAGLDGRPQSDV